MDWANFISKLLDFFKKRNIFLGSVDLTCFIFLFSPDSWLIKLGLKDFVNSIKPYLSIVLIVVTSYLVLLLIESICFKISAKIKNYDLNRFKLNLLKNSNPIEKEIMRRMYNSPSKTIDLAFNDSTTTLMETKLVIRRGSFLSKGGVYFSYFLQPWVIEYINKHSNFLMEKEKKDREGNHG